MHVVCPGCSTHYALAAHLLGPTGARVCCPTCWLTFLLDAHGALTAVLGRDTSRDTNGSTHTAQAVSHEDAAPALPPDSGPDDGVTEAARVALGALDAPPGTLAAAASAGRLFAEHGPALLDRFEALERAGAADAFRAALAAVAGVDVTPSPGPG